jgi:DHA1 family multidrug resistance protein-like MFS transporter
MADIIRDSTFGQLIRFVTGNKLLLYPEEIPGFQCPSSYGESILSEKQPEPSNQQASGSRERSETIEKQTEAGVDIDPSDSSDSSSTPELRSVVSHATTFRDEDHNPISRIGTLPGWDGLETQADVERAYTNPSLVRGESRPVIPTRTADGTILVDWYTTDDPENPQNWSSGKKGFVVLQIW